VQHLSCWVSSWQGKTPPGPAQQGLARGREEEAAAQGARWALRRHRGEGEKNSGLEFQLYFKKTPNKQNQKPIKQNTL